MCELLEKAKEKQGIKSNYELAKKLDISQELISRWKTGKSKPNGEHSLILADMANVTPKEALRMLQAGYTRMSLIFVTALLSIIAIAPFLTTANCILCKIDGQVLVVGKVESKLLHLGVHELSHLLAANDSEINQVPANCQNQSLVYAKFGKP